MAKAIQFETPGALPPVGDARQEELKRRTDVLAEKLETSTPEAYAFDPKKLDIDNEIAYFVTRNELDVTGKQDGCRYRWVHFGQNGRSVTGAKLDGWEVVSGSDPESVELRAVDGTRRLGDVLLMRIDERRAIRLEQVDRYRRQLEQES